MLSERGRYLCWILNLRNWYRSFPFLLWKKSGKKVFPLSCRMLKANMIQQIKSNQIKVSSRLFWIWLLLYQSPICLNFPFYSSRSFLRSCVIIIIDSSNPPTTVCQSHKSIVLKGKACFIDLRRQCCSLNTCFNDAQSSRWDLPNTENVWVNLKQYHSTLFYTEVC